MTFLPETPLLAPAPFTTRFADRPEILARAVDLFFRETTKALAQLRALDFPAQRNLCPPLAHGLKGSARTIGAPRLAALAENLERAPGGDAAAFRQGLDELERTLDATMDGLLRMLSEAKSGTNRLNH